MLETPVQTPTVSIRKAPRVPGIPLLTDSLGMLNDPLSYLTRAHQKLGPVFRVRMGKIDYAIMAGLEANLFLQQRGEQHFGSETLFGDMAELLRTDVMLTMLDGPDHRHVRKISRAGFSRSAIVPHLDKVIEILQQHSERWTAKGEMSVLDAMRRLVTDQIGQVTTGFQPGERFQDVLIWLQTAMNVTVVKLWPRLMLQRPAFKDADAHLREFGTEILNFHRQNPPETTGRPRDLIDDMLEGIRPDGQPFSEDDLLSQAYGPFFAGIDTLASTIAFGLYAIIKQPELRAQIEAEAAELFTGGALDMNQMRKMPMLHAAAIETLRRYPVTPFTPRNVTEPFDFGGYHFEHGTEVMIAQTVTHLLPEYYKDPYTFNANRHLDGGDTPPVGAFAPYTLGAHTCLGAGLAEVLLMLDLAAILHFTKPRFTSPDYVAPVKTLPLPNPGPKFTLLMN